MENKTILSAQTVNTLFEKCAIRNEEDLKNTDRCTWCRQSFIYDDIENNKYMSIPKN